MEGTQGPAHRRHTSSQMADLNVRTAACGCPKAPAPRLSGFPDTGRGGERGGKGGPMARCRHRLVSGGRLRGVACVAAQQWSCALARDEAKGVSRLASISIKALPAGPEPRPSHRADSTPERPRGGQTHQLEKGTYPSPSLCHTDRDMDILREL
jgi:hypothetical protein